MENVKAIRAKIAEADYNPRGTLSAYTRVDAVGFNGMRVNKRVRIGVEFGVTPDNAKEMMHNLRNANNGDFGNPKADIAGRLIIDF